MKIKVNDFEIEIKAKDTITSKKYNKKDTLYFLNWLSFALNGAANYQESIDAHAVAKEMRTAGKELFLICEDNGLYCFKID